jgi:hypothetical protein
VVKKSIMVNFLKNSSIILNMVPNNIYVTKWIIKKLTMVMIIPSRKIVSPANHGDPVLFLIGQFCVVAKVMMVYRTI